MSQRQSTRTRSNAQAPNDPSIPPNDSSLQEVQLTTQQPTVGTKKSPGRPKKSTPITTTSMTDDTNLHTTTTISKSKSTTRNSRKSTTTTTTTTTSTPISQPPSQSKPWSSSDFQRQKSLGDGQFGQVYKAIELNSQHTVALKYMAKRTILEHNALIQIKREIEIHSHLINPYILRLYGYFFEPEKIVLIMELLSGTLYKQLSTFGRFTHTRASSVIHNITSALVYLHQNDIVHRDIKPENILFQQQDGRQIYKLADFGWATFTDRKNRLTLCGTRDFIAPEVLLKQGYTKSIDIWSLGCMLYELLIGKPPFDEDLYANGILGFEEYEQRAVKDSYPSVMTLMDELRDERDKLIQDGGIGDNSMNDMNNNDEKLNDNNTKIIHQTPIKGSKINTTNIHTLPTSSLKSNQFQTPNTINMNQQRRTTNKNSPFTTTPKLLTSTPKVDGQQQLPQSRRAMYSPKSHQLKLEFQLSQDVKNNNNDHNHNQNDINNNSLSIFTTNQISSPSSTRKSKNSKQIQLQSQQPEQSQQQQYDEQNPSTWSDSQLEERLDGLFPSHQCPISTMKRIVLADIHYPSWLNPLAKDLLTKMLTFDPSKRITATEILQHPYITAFYNQNQFDIDEEYEQFLYNGAITHVPYTWIQNHIIQQFMLHGDDWTLPDDFPVEIVNLEELRTIARDIDTNTITTYQLLINPININTEEEMNNDETDIDDENDISIGRRTGRKSTTRKSTTTRKSRKSTTRKDDNVMNCDVADLLAVMHMKQTKAQRIDDVTNSFFNSDNNDDEMIGNDNGVATTTTTTTTSNRRKSTRPSTPISKSTSISTTPIKVTTTTTPTTTTTTSTSRTATPANKGTKNIITNKNIKNNNNKRSRGYDLDDDIADDYDNDDNDINMNEYGDSDGDDEMNDLTIENTNLNKSIKFDLTCATKISTPIKSNNKRTTTIPQQKPDIFLQTLVATSIDDDSDDDTNIRVRFHTDDKLETIIQSPIRVLQQQKAYELKRLSSELDFDDNDINSTQQLNNNLDNINGSNINGNNQSTTSSTATGMKSSLVTGKRFIISKKHTPAITPSTTTSTTNTTSLPSQSPILISTSHLPPPSISTTSIKSTSNIDFDINNIPASFKSTPSRSNTRRRTVMPISSSMGDNDYDNNNNNNQDDIDASNKDITDSITTTTTTKSTPTRTKSSKTKQILNEQLIEDTIVTTRTSTRTTRKSSNTAQLVPNQIDDDDEIIESKSTRSSSRSKSIKRNNNDVNQHEDIISPTPVKGSNNRRKTVVPSQQLITDETDNENQQVETKSTPKRKYTRKTTMNNDDNDIENDNDETTTTSTKSKSTTKATKSTPRKSNSRKSTMNDDNDDDQDDDIVSTSNSTHTSTRSKSTSKSTKSAQKKSSTSIQSSSPPDKVKSPPISIKSTRTRSTRRSQTIEQVMDNVIALASPPQRRTRTKSVKSIQTTQIHDDGDNNNDDEIVTKVVKSSKSKKVHVARMSIQSYASSTTTPTKSPRKSTSTTKGTKTKSTTTKTKSTSSTSTPTPTKSPKLIRKPQTPIDLDTLPMTPRRITRHHAKELKVAKSPP